MEWYPKKLLVGVSGVESTLNFLKSVFEKEASFNYAEFGIYQGSTALAVAEYFPNSILYLFDFDSTIELARERFLPHENRVHFFQNTQKYNDSYNWSLSKLLKSDPSLQFDYVFLDGAHTFAIDALTFFMTSLMLSGDGYIDFDDYDWRLRGSSLDPEKVPSISDQYTNEQIDDYQVRRIVDLFVKDKGFIEVVPNKVFKKTKILSNSSALQSTETTMSSDEVEFLQSHIAESQNYLEFGSGHSTMIAIEYKGLRVFSFESDLNYKEFLVKKLETLAFDHSSVRIIHVDIGETGEWGWPIESIGVVKYPNYFYSPFKLLKSENFMPDLILIDARFRIATFLMCYQLFPKCTILFDDYGDRPAYHVIEKLIKPRKMRGRIAQFNSPKRISSRKRKLAMEMILEFGYDPS